MREVDVVYLYENIARELDVACAVAAILRQKYNCSVEIVQWPHSVPRLYGHLKPRVVVLPFCYFEHSFDCLLEWRDSIFVNLTWEQLFYEGNIRAKTPRGDFAINHVLHQAWSKGYAEFARQQAIPEQHIFLNGQPAYALYDEPYRRYFADRGDLAARHSLDRERRWVFFPENYNWAFYSKEVLRAFVKRGQTPEQLQEMREFCNRSFAEVMRWFAGLAHSETVEVIVRPRPSTPLAEFRTAVERVVGEIPCAMHIIQAESVREWIMASDVVLSSHSTSLIEAAVAGRSAYMVAPFGMPTLLRQEWHGLVPHIESEEDFRKAALASPVDVNVDALGAWARSTFMSRGDAIGNLAAYIARVIRGDVERPSVPSRLCATAQGDTREVPKWLWFVFRRLRARFRRLIPASGDQNQMAEFVSTEEIDRRIGRWQELLNNQTAKQAAAATDFGSNPPAASQSNLSASRV